MKGFKIKWLIFLVSCSRLQTPVQATPSEYKPITVIVLSYNNEKVCEKNLSSILNQKYPNFRVLYIDDCSTDRTFEKVTNYLKSSGKKDLITIQRNTENQGAMANFYRAVHACVDHEVVAMVDGDDWLAHENVLMRINTAYADPQTWMTYGQHIESSDGCLGGCRPVKRNNFRQQSFVTSHLKTFYAGLFKKIAKEDLCKNGRFFSMCSDQAAMLPMLEMAGKHLCFIPEVLYIYNQGNPLSDQYRNEKFQRETSCYIRNLPPYSPIDDELWAIKLQK